MKRLRTLIILCLLFVLLIVGIITVKKVKEHIDTINTIDEVIMAISEEELTNFSWNTDDASLSFSKDTSWIYDNDTDFPVDSEKIMDFLETFEEVHASFIIEDIEDYEQYGLKDPQYVMSFKTADNEYTLNVGNYSTMDSKTYVSIGDGKVYLVDVDIPEHINIDRDEFILDDTVPELDQILEFAVSGETVNKIKYEPDAVYTYTDTYDYFFIDGDSHLAVPSTNATTYMNTVAALELTDYASYTASADDLSLYGLDNPALTVSVKGEKADEEDEDSVVTIEYQMYIGYVIDEETETEEDEEPAKFVFVRLKDSEMVYLVDQSVYDTILAGSYNDLRPSFILLADKDNIKSFEFNLEGTDYLMEYRITSEEGAEEETGDYFINDTAVASSDLISKINSTKIQDFNVEPNGGQLEFSITVNTNSENYTVQKIDLYRYDGEYCYAKLNDENLGLITRSAMIDLKEAVLTIILDMDTEVTE